MKIAKKLGADFVIKAGGCDAKTLSKQIRDGFGMADRTIECTGAESSIHTAIYVSASVWNSRFYQINEPFVLLAIKKLKKLKTRIPALYLIINIK